MTPFYQSTLLLHSLRNRVFLAIDLLGWLLIPAAGLMLRLDSVNALHPYLPHLGAFVALAAACKFASLWAFGIYRRYWRYASIEELELIVVAVLVAGVAAGTLYFALMVPLWSLESRLPYSLPVIDTMLTLLFVGGTRFAVRSAEHLRRKWRGASGSERVLIAGAGSAGTMIIRELHANPQLEMEPVAFVDDDPAKHGKTICGLPVVGGRERIPEVARDYGVHKVIIAMPTAPGSVIRDVRDLCARAQVQAKTVPGVFEILSGRVSIGQLRDVQIEDLLRRQPIRTDQRAVGDLVRNMSVLVTGAGGSIGSEVCRQVARLGARELILLGHGENSIFDIHHELLVKYAGLRVRPVIADIRNARRMQRVFDAFRPQAVFHAAAHKHVPLMEENPEEAVTNNVQGTLNVLDAAEAVGVSHFVFVSTDKAVNPANVMGATKLLAEMLVHDAAVRTGRHYVTVRFGNVLASRGSVVPLFKQQIKAGGPLTVTHPQMTRYFMTIPEAVQLVLQAGTMGTAGETYVLDMGDPVRIADLAKDVIQLSGLELGRDVDIVYSGLRPGEKLNEDLFGSAEEVERTAHQKIFVVRNGRPLDAPIGRIRELISAAEAEEPLRVRHLLTQILPSYPIQLSPVESADKTAAKRPAVGV